MRPELHSFVALASHVALIVMFVSAIGVFVLRLFRRVNAPARHAIALSFLVGIVVVPLMATAYQFQFVRATPLPATEQRLVAQEHALPNQSTNAEELDETDGDGGFREGASNRTTHWLLATLTVVWLVGAIGFTLGRVIGICRERQYLIHLPAVTNQAVLETAGRLEQQMGIRRNVILLRSRHTPWPFTVGVWNPQIILPMELAKAAESQRLEAALIHELAHISRGDYAVAMFEGLVRTAFWWNPFIHSIVAELNVAREQICDSFVLNHNGDGKSLAEYLISSMERAANARFSWGVGMSANEPHNVELRINRLMSGDNKMLRIPNYAKGPVLCCSIFLCVAAVHVNYARAQFVLGTPVNFGPIVNSEARESHPSLSDDGLTLYFHSGNRPGSAGIADIWMSTRDSLDAGWMPVENFAAINTAASELSPFISTDGRTFLYNDGLVENQPATIYQLSRDTDEGPWGPRSAFPAPINDGVSNSSSAFLSADGNILLFHSDREGGEGMMDLYEANRPSAGEPWTVRNLGPNVNSPVHENNPVMSSDGRTLIFGSERADGLGGFDIWISTRDSINADWGTAMNLGPTINTPGAETPSQLWEPGNLLLFRSTGHGGEGGADMFYVNVVPEPSTAMLTTFGSLMVVGLVRNRRRMRN